MSQSSPDPIPNPEAQRLLLLQAMGIRSYYPRFQLPGALPSVACAWVQEEAVVTPVPVVATVASGVVTEAPASVAAVVTESPVATEALLPERRPASARPETSQKAAQNAVPGRSHAEHSATPSFQVLLVLADKGLAICNQLPAVARPALSRSEQQLLNNILLWLGCSLQSGTAQRHFTWPLPGLAATDADQASKGLHSFLAQAQQDSGFSRLLLLGNSSVDCLQSRLEREDVPWQTWCTHSLAELLALPALKRQAWQQLQTLHAELR